MGDTEMKDRYIMGVDPYNEDGGGSYTIYDTIEKVVVSSGALDVLPNEPIKTTDGWIYNVRAIPAVKEL